MLFRMMRYCNVRCSNTGPSFFLEFLSLFYTERFPNINLEFLMDYWTVVCSVRGWRVRIWHPPTLGYYELVPLAGLRPLGCGVVAWW